jgi:6-phosphogluconolactonase (cycloisomerase 2 family)
MSFRAIVIVALAFLWNGCGGSSSPGPSAGQGSLSVSIGGLPAGASGDVAVSGPAGYSQKLTATQTLTGLAVGNYSVSATDVPSGSTSYSAAVTGSPASVSAGATATVAVAYSLVAPTTGSLAITVGGLPAGVSGDVTVSGPGGFSQHVATTQSLNGLSPGSYTVAAQAVSSAATTYAPTVTGSPATVSAGATANASVAYAAAAAPVAQGRFLYSTNFADGTVAAFKIDPGSGALTLLGTVLAVPVGSPATGTWGIAVHPSNQFLYVVFRSGTLTPTLFGYSIGATGALTPTAQGSVALAGGLEMIGIAPGGDFLYLTDFNNGRIFQFSVDASDGSLTALSPPTISTLGTGPIGIRVDPSGKFVYVADQCGIDPSNGCGQIEAFRKGATGALSSIGVVDSLGPNGGGSPSLLTVDAAGKYLYAADAFLGHNGEVVTQFSIGATGALTFVAAVPLQNGVRPFDFALAPDGASAFATSTTSEIARFTVDPSTGGLTASSTSSFFGQTLAIDRGGKVLFLPLGSQMEQLSIDSSGTLQPIGAGVVDNESPPNPSGNSFFCAIAY